MLVAYSDFIFQLLHSVGLGLYGTNTIFFTALFLGWASIVFTASPNEALDVDALTFIPFLSFEYSASSFTDISSLELELPLIYFLHHHSPYRSLQFA